MTIIRPRIKLLDNKHIRDILLEAKEILETHGILVKNIEAREILNDHGLNHTNERFYIPSDVVEKLLRTCPQEIKLYDREGDNCISLSGDNVHFDPGSAAIYFLDEKTEIIREATSQDFKRFTKLVSQLSNLDAQSTSIVYNDVPKNAQDWHRLYICLKYCSKPIVTGIFRKESFPIMKELLLACRNSDQDLKTKPLAIFDACPSPPLIWSDLTAQSVINAAKSMIPSEFISMPLAGANAPITLIGAITQHCAETLSGIVISQLVKKGAPIIWGGSPSIMDMKKGTTPMGAIETMMINIGNAQIGKHLNLPTHAYMSLSDSKIVDGQSGIEATAGAILAGLAGINMISGPGMLDFESTQSLQKLLIDNEIVGMVKRLINGIKDHGNPFASEILKDFEKSNELLSHQSTLNLYKEELFFPSRLIDRNTRESWSKLISKDIKQRANDLINELEKKPTSQEIHKNEEKELEKIVSQYLN